MFVLVSRDAASTERVTRKSTVRKICPNLVQIVFFRLTTQLLVDGNLFFTCHLLSLVDVSGELADLPSYSRKFRHIMEWTWILRASRMLSSFVQ